MKKVKTLISSPTLYLQNFFHEFNLYQLDIAPSYHPIQFTAKLINQTWENGQKNYFAPTFGLFGPNLGLKIFFHRLYLYQYLDNVPSYHPMQFKRKLKKLEKMTKNLILMQILTQLWVPKIYFVSFTSTRAQSLFQAIIVCN